MMWRIVIRYGAQLVGLRRGHGWRRRKAPPPAPVIQPHGGGDVDEVLHLMARMIYERTYLRSWRNADFWTRAQLLQTARALLETLEVRDIFMPPFAAEVRSLATGRQANGPPCVTHCRVAACEYLSVEGRQAPVPPGSSTHAGRVPASPRRPHPVALGPSGCAAE